MQIIVWDDNGVLCVLTPTGEKDFAEVLANDVPPGVAPVVVESENMPADRFFRGAWKLGAGGKVFEGIAGSRKIAHEIRRADRAKKLAPLDIEATIPGKAAAAEAAREVIRQANAKLQADIDAAAKPDDIRLLLAGL